tara:strand:- start:587 stop:799 length:213 start_codon:yes stop_codon:yes gene_type:complete
MYRPPNKLVRKEKYYNEMCELLLDNGIQHGSLLYELVDIMEREYTQGATDVRTKRAFLTKQKRGTINKMG